MLSAIYSVEIKTEPHMAAIGWCTPLLAALSLLTANFAVAQDKGSVNPEPLPPLTNPNDPRTPAKELFGRKTVPAPLAARAIGF